MEVPFAMQSRNVHVIDVSKPALEHDPSINRDLVNDVMTTRRYDMYAFFGTGDTARSLKTRVLELLKAMPHLRCNLFVVDTQTDFIKMICEYAVRVHMYGNIKLTMALSNVPISICCALRDMAGLDIDGDLVVPWPDQPNFWFDDAMHTRFEKNPSYAPFESRSDMQRAHAEAIRKRLSASRLLRPINEKIALVRIYLNTGVDFIQDFPELVSGMVVVPEKDLIRNLSSRAKAQKEEGGVPQPVDHELEILSQVSMANAVRFLRKPIYQGFNDPRLRNAHGLIVAVAGSGKTTFVKKQNARWFEFDAMSTHDQDVSRMSWITEGSLDDFRSLFLIASDRFSAITASEDKKAPDAHTEKQVGRLIGKSMRFGHRNVTSCPPEPEQVSDCMPFSFNEGMMYIGAHDFVGLLEEANALKFFDSEPLENTFSTLVKKAGSCALVYSMDPQVNRFDKVLKKFDPLEAQVGKLPNTMFTFDHELIAVQNEYASPAMRSQGIHLGEKYPENFARFYVYLMGGCSPSDRRRDAWYGVVPQQINVKTGFWNMNTWSTSPFGCLYNPGPKQPVMPLFPELMANFKFGNVRAYVTKLDLVLGWSFRPSELSSLNCNHGINGDELMPYEWVFEGPNSYTASSGYVRILDRRRDTKIYDVELVGERFSRQDEVPHVTFQHVPYAHIDPKMRPRIDRGSVLPILRVITKSGVRIAYVRTAGTDGHITLGPAVGEDRRFQAATSPFVHHVDNQKGLTVKLTKRGDIEPGDTVFRCGVRFDEATLIYFMCVNRGLMGIGKLPKRMSMNEIAEKVRMRVMDGTDRSGHILLAAKLPPLQQCVFLASVALNMSDRYTGAGIYKWSGLPLGRWHTVDDYRTAIDFGSSTASSPNEKRAYEVFDGFFRRLSESMRDDAFTGLQALSPYLYPACRQLLKKMLA